MIQHYVYKLSRDEVLIGDYADFPFMIWLQSIIMCQAKRYFRIELYAGEALWLDS